MPPWKPTGRQRRTSRTQNQGDFHPVSQGTAAIVALSVLVVSCADTPALEDRDAICPLFGEAREARAGDDREATQAAVVRLLTVLPENYHDEIALWYYPVGGSVDGLDTSGVAAEEAGDLLEGLYRANC